MAEGVYDAFPRVRFRSQMKDSWTLTMTLIGLAIVWNLVVFIGVIFLLMQRKIPISRRRSRYHSNALNNATEYYRAPPNPRGRLTRITGYRAQQPRFSLARVALA